MTTQSPYQSLIGDLLDTVKGDPFWEICLSQFTSQVYPSFTLHLAILVEPYLQFILEGKKTIESRFSIHRCPPYKRVNKGDIILLKRSSGPIVGICQVSNAWFYQLDPSSWKTIKEDFSLAICAQDPAFWKDREAASFATLIRINHVRAIDPIKYVKRDRRGWVILQPAQIQLRFDNL